MTEDNGRTEREHELGADRRRKDTIRLTPESRYRPRVDGGRDETFRINFEGRLKAREMRALVELLLALQDQQPDVGLIALTKAEFIEPDTLEYRYWSGKPEGTRLDRMFELWQQMNQIHPIYTVDGIQYPWLGTSKSGQG